LGRLIALTLALVVGAVIAWSQHAPPAALPADAPARIFSAGRAFETVRAVGGAPHVMGTAANRRVRDLLLARMTALGLSPRVRSGDVVAPPRFGANWGGSPESLIGVLPGRHPKAPAVALMAHYDSRPGAPGAADDGAGVATALETIRAIAARGPPTRDVVLILTDGEEAGLLGAREVFADDPIVRRIGLVLNLDARGSGGRVLMYETGPDDGEAIGFFREFAVRPLAGSIFSVIYATLPSDTDFSVARRAGLQGFNYAFTGQAFDYHAPTDTPGNLEPGALQDMGDQVFAAAGAAATAPWLPGPAPDAVHGVVFGRSMIRYAPNWGWAPLLLSALLLGAAVWRARRRERGPWIELARGAGAAVFMLATAAVLLRLARAAAVAFADQPWRRLLALSGRFELALMLIGLGALLFAAAEAARGRRAPGVLVPLLAGAASCALSRSLDVTALAEGLAAAVLALAIGRGPISRPGAWGGVLLLGLAAGVATQLAAPLAAYVIAWPLVMAALAAAATDLGGDRRPDRLAVLALIAALTAGWAGTYAHLAYVVSGKPELLLLPLFMVALPIWPLAQPEAGAPPARLAGRGLLIAGAAVVLLVRLSGAWDERRPQASFVGYQLDQDAGLAWRIGSPALRTPWSDAALRSDGGPVTSLTHWAWRQPMDAAPARPAAIAPPALSLARGEDGVVTVTVTPPAGVRTLSLQLSPDVPARLVGAGSAPIDLPLPPGQWTRLVWSAPPARGLALRLRPSGPGALQLRYAMTLDGWPAGVAPANPPPPRVMAVENSGDGVVTGTRSLAW
jgi:hypothetical protein